MPLIKHSVSDPCEPANEPVFSYPTALTHRMVRERAKGMDRPLTFPKTARQGLMTQGCHTHAPPIR